MTYTIIYDGNCNLCSNLVQVLESLDQGQRFRYLSMQQESALRELGITASDCELGMILLDPNNPTQRWQGSEAAEKIGELLPLSAGLIAMYRALPGVKWAGDRIYEQVRDHRYTLFGKRDTTYQSRYPACDTGTCGDPFPIASVPKPGG